MILSGRSARCTSPAGSYVEVRDAGTRVLPGPVEEVSNYMVGTGPTDKIAFSTPDHSTYCMGSAEEGELTCIAGTNTKDSSGMPVMRSVKISKTAAPVVEEFSTALPYESIEQIKPVDVGTTLTSLGVSCSPQDASTMHCVNPLGGFTLSIDGYAPTA